MIFRNLRYFFSQGIRGLVSNSLMTLASVGIVIASLVLFGTFVLLGMNLNYIGEQIKEQCEINVYLPRDMRRDDVRKIGSELAKIKYVKEAQLYTKEERFNNFKDSSYEEQADVIDMLEQDNPLRDSYILVLEDVSRANEVAAAAGKIDGVEEVVNSQHLIQRIITLTNAIRHISIWLILVLAVVSVFIISNTIKLGMFSRRKEINIMKFVGATNWFIRWPFIIEGMFLGIIGALIASGIVLLGYESIYKGMQDFMGNIRFLELYEVSGAVVLGFLIMGVGMGMIGSAMSIRKHLHV